MLIAAEAIGTAGKDVDWANVGEEKNDVHDRHEREPRATFQIRQTVCFSHVGFAEETRFLQVFAAAGAGAAFLTRARIFLCRILGVRARAFSSAESLACARARNEERK